MRGGATIFFLEGAAEGRDRIEPAQEGRLFDAALESRIAEKGLGPFEPERVDVVVEGYPQLVVQTVGEVAAVGPHLRGQVVERQLGVEKQLLFADILLEALADERHPVAQWFHRLVFGSGVVFR